MEARIDCGTLRRIMRRLLKFPCRIVLDTNDIDGFEWVEGNSNLFGRDIF